MTGAFIWLHLHAPLDVVVAHAMCRPSEAILEALGGLYMQDCRYELRRIPLLGISVNKASKPLYVGYMESHQGRETPSREGGSANDH
jgi:hypothetical protein